MNTTRFFFLLLMGIITCTGAHAAPDPFKSGQVVDRVVCATDAAQSYALYIPAKGNKEPMPVIYMFDPHGDGALPLRKYHALADTYGFILIGSHNSKNGNDWTATEAIWRAISSDTQKRLKIDRNRIYAAGFSGGAKVAGYIALHHSEVKAVVVNGAGLPDEIAAGNFSFSITAITGEGDMNMTDLVAFSNALDRTQTKHCILFFDGIHEWAPANTMDIAFAGLQLDAMRRKLVAKDNTFISDKAATCKKRTDALYKSNELVKAFRECTAAISLLDGLTGEVSWFKEKVSSLANNAVYKQQWQAQQQLLQAEQQTKDVYMRQFQQDDRNYWVTTISSLHAKVKLHNAESAMDQRLLAYLSLAFYSFSNQLINRHQDDVAAYFVDLYKLADPANSEAWYFSAILHARHNEVQAAENDLIKSVECGFTDKARLRQQQEFQKVRLVVIESRMKK